MEFSRVTERVIYNELSGLAIGGVASPGCRCLDLLGVEGDKDRNRVEHIALGQSQLSSAPTGVALVREGGGKACLHLMPTCFGGARAW